MSKEVYSWQENCYHLSQYGLRLEPAPDALRMVCINAQAEV